MKPIFYSTMLNTQTDAGTYCTSFCCRYLTLTVSLQHQPSVLGEFSLPVCLSCPEDSTAPRLELTSA